MKQAESPTMLKETVLAHASVGEMVGKLAVPREMAKAPVLVALSDF